MKTKLFAFLLAGLLCLNLPVLTACFNLQLPSDPLDPPAVDTIAPIETDISNRPSIELPEPELPEFSNPPETADHVSPTPPNQGDKPQPPSDITLTTDSTSDLDDSTSDPDDSTSDPDDSTSDPDDSTSDPDETTTDPDETTTDPDETTDTEVTSDSKFVFELLANGQEYCVTSCLSLTDTDITVPSTHNGYPVTAIGDSAFVNCSYYLTSITLPNSIKTIGTSAFSGCMWLREVTLSNTLTEIGNYAFNNCRSMTEISLPATLKRMGNSVFDDCRSLSSISLPEGLTHLGEYAFTNCYALTRLHLPSTLTEIGEHAFHTCSELESITVAEGNPKYHSQGNCLIETESKVLLLGCKNSVIPSDGSVTEIFNSAFTRMKGVTSITVPANVTKICASAFSECEELTSLTIGPDVEQIDYFIVARCPKLKTITVDSNNETFYSLQNCIVKRGTGTTPDSIVVGCVGSTIPTDASIQTIDMYAFYECYGLTSIVIPDNITYMRGAFANCSDLVSMTIGTGLTETYNVQYQWNTYKLVEIINHSSITMTPGSSGLPSVYALEVHSESTSKIDNRNGYLFYTEPNGTHYLLGYNGEDTHLTLPESYDGESYEIYERAFYSRHDLTGVTFSAGVSAIGEKAFYYCDGITSLSIPSTCTVVGNSAFLGCDSLESLYVASELIDHSAFYSCESLTDLTIAEGVTEIRSTAFSCCASLTTITLPDSVTTLGAGAFDHCYMLQSISLGSGLESMDDNPFLQAFRRSSITISNENPHYQVISNCLIDTRTKTLVVACNNSTIPSADFVEKIGYGAFYACHQMESVVIPDWITDVDSQAFAHCYTLTDVTIGSGLQKLPNNAFFGCVLLEEISIPATIDTIGAYAFSHCFSLRDVAISNSVTAIKDGAFGSCMALQTLTIPSSVTSIGSATFSYCESLTQMTIPDSVTSLGSEIFSYCPSLTQITIGSGVQTIGTPLLRKPAENLSITVSTNNPYYRVIGNCLVDLTTQTVIQGLPSSTIPTDANVTAIGQYAFLEIDGLTSIVIPDNIETVSYDAFVHCNDLTTIVIRTQSVSASAFRFNDQNALQTIIVGSEVESMNQTFDFSETGWDYQPSAKLYYEGSREDWQELSFDVGIPYDSIYFYAESAPTPDPEDYSPYLYWHYVGGVPTAWEQPE